MPTTHSRVACIALALAASLAVSTPALRAQATEAAVLTEGRSNGTVATVAAVAPIFLLPDAGRQPIRMAKEGSRLKVLGSEKDWLNVQFQDPQFGLRTGYIQTRFVKVDDSRMEPVDVSIPVDEPRAVPAAANQVRSLPLERAQPGLPGARDVDLAPDYYTTKSRSRGFFLGFGLEGNGIVPYDNGLSSSTESGRGGGLVIGYGFSPRWSLYGVLSGARMDAADFSGTYGLGHFDLGTRVHFPRGSSRAVPFLQLGLAGRAISERFYLGSRQYEVTASGAGFEFGGGVNVHMTQGLAFSPGVTWMAGNFSSYQINGTEVGGDTVGAMSARVHLGLIWFPSSNQRR